MKSTLECPLCGTHVDKKEDYCPECGETLKNNDYPNSLTAEVV